MNINFDKSKIKEVLEKDKFYPERLKNIFGRPQKLYVLGNEKILNIKSIAIIGCRNCSRYGMKNAYEFGYGLAKKGICVVSGFARGVDRYSHIGALKAFEQRKIKFDMVARNIVWKYYRYLIRIRIF